MSPGCSPSATCTWPTRRTARSSRISARPRRGLAAAGGGRGELFADIEWALRTLSDRFATVIWMPGNHELWTHRDDPVRLRGEERYLSLVELCRSLGVLTPEDPYPVWAGPGGAVTIAPLFLLYDYTFLPDGALTKEAGPGPGVRDRHRLQRRGAAVPRPLSEPGSLVLGQDRGDRAPARRAGPGAARSSS